MAPCFVYSNDRIASSMTDSGKSRLRFGPFDVDLNTRELRKSGVRVKLSGQPFEILTALLERPGQLVTRDQLRKRVWSEDTFVDFSHGLNAAVNKLREALCDSADEPRYIETLPRRGYRFIAHVEESASISPTLIAPAPAVQEPVWKGSLANEEWETTVPVKRQTLAHVGALLAMIVVFALGITRFWPAGPDLRSNEEQERDVRLAAERSVSNGPGILHLDLVHAENTNALKRVISGQEAIGGPQPSPDGKKLVYMSGRTEATEIWVCNPDGSSPKALTNVGNAGTPRWSPDSRWIAFDSDGRYGHSGIYIVSSEGGAIRPLVEDGWNNSVPSWSRDGKWIYFASNRARDSEEEELWKVPVEGGQLVRITRQGGFSAYESVDGQAIFYAKSRYQNPEIWQVPVNGGTETRVSSLLRPSTWANWAVTDRGILFLSEYSEQASDLQYFNFANRTVRSLATLEKASFWLSASTDGSSVWYSELTDYQARQVFKAGLD